MRIRRANRPALPAATVLITLIFEHMKTAVNQTLRDWYTDDKQDRQDKSKIASQESRVLTQKVLTLRLSTLLHPVHLVYPCLILLVFDLGINRIRQ